MLNINNKSLFRKQLKLIVLIFCLISVCIAQVIVDQDGDETIVDQDDDEITDGDGSRDANGTRGGVEPRGRDRGTG